MLVLQVFNAPAPKQNNARSEIHFKIEAPGRSAEQINKEMSTYLDKLGYGDLKGLAYAARGGKANNIRLYFVTDRPVRMGVDLVSAPTNETSFADRKTRQDPVIQISKDWPGDAGNLMIKIIYPKGGDPPDVLVISPSGHVSYSREIDGKLARDRKYDFQLAKAAKSDW